MLGALSLIFVDRAFYIGLLCCNGWIDMTKTIKVEDLKKDIRLGLTDDNILLKYNLSEKSSGQLFEKLARAVCTGKTTIEIEE